MDARTIRDRASGLAAVGALAVASAAGAVAAAAAQSPRAATGDGGFGGRPTAPARPLDRDVESGGRDALRRVACASGAPGTTCWISTSTRG